MMPPQTQFGNRHVVISKTSAAGSRKLFSVGFGRDGTTYVFLPYFAETAGLFLREVGRLIEGKISIDRRELPHTTSARVKFSYHPDGRAHFSQDGRIRTTVIARLPPLVIHEGPLFQVQAYGLDRYEPLEPNAKRATLVDCTPGPEALGVVVTGYICKPGLSAVDSQCEPRLIARSPLSPMLIALGCKQLRAPAAYDGAHLIFAGGPSAPVIEAPGASRTVLIAAYPRGRASVLFPETQCADL